MTIGLIGLGRMGQAIAARLIDAGITIICYDKFITEPISKEPLLVHAKTIADVASKARVIWLMVPQGQPVDDILEQLKPHVKKNDVIIDGGNSFYHDTIRRHAMLKEKEVFYLDAGTSGGLQGRDFGFCLMIGGDRIAYDLAKKFFSAIAAPNGCRYLGPSGAGHYVKMVHNGIEYGLLEAYAEGFHIIKNGHYPDLDLAEIGDVWNHGSIIRSWILELAHRVFKKDQSLDTIGGQIGENLTGLWTYEEAKRNDIPVEVIKAALDVRAESRKTGGNYATKVVALLRHEFGGHPITHVSSAKRLQKNNDE